MPSSLIQKISRNLSNLPGWRTDRRILVFESDDWGSIRMPSKEVYDQLLKNGVPVDTNHHTRYDTLESNDDLAALFESLAAFKDKNGNHPVFTALCIVANPDFEKIRAADFQSYHYEWFTETLKRYGRHDRVLELWREGHRQKLFHPQFHGREHVNVHHWMRGLRKGLKVTRLTFDLELTGISPAIAGENRKEYQAAFDIEEITEIEYLRQVIREGTTIFKELMGYAPSFFVPTNTAFSSELEPELLKAGIKYINSSKIQREPLGAGQYRKNFRYLGKRNRHGQVYLTRNAFFEPSKPNKPDWVASCLEEIQSAFAWKKPAIISTHRVNYCGYIDPANRERGLRSLSELISNVLKIWPDVEFMTSDQVGALIEKTQSSTINR